MQTCMHAVGYMYLLGGNIKLLWLQDFLIEKHKQIFPHRIINSNCQKFTSIKDSLEKSV